MFGLSSLAYIFGEFLILLEIARVPCVRLRSNQDKKIKIVTCPEFDTKSLCPQNARMSVALARSRRLHFAPPCSHSPLPVRVEVSIPSPWRMKRTDTMRLPWPPGAMRRRKKRRRHQLAQRGDGALFYHHGKVAKKSSMERQKAALFLRCSLARSAHDAGMLCARKRDACV